MPPTSQTQPDQDQAAIVIDANAVVSYNLRTIRNRRGWTQLEVAERLGRLTGHQLPQTSISFMEGSFDGDRHRRFDAHELYLVAEVFDVPIAYFFLPPPASVSCNRFLADTGRPLWDLYGAILGRDDQLAVLEERLAQLDAGDQEVTLAIPAIMLEASTEALGWADHYRQWRIRRIHQLTDQWADRVLEAASVLRAFVLEHQARGLDSPRRGSSVEERHGDQRILGGRS